MVSVGELTTHGGSVYEDYQLNVMLGGGAEGRNVPAAIEVKLREFVEDVLTQKFGTLQDAVLKGVKCDPASEEYGRVAGRKGSVDARSEKLDSRADRSRKSDNGRHSYGKGGTDKQVAEDVTKIVALELVRVLPVSDNNIRGEMGIHVNPPLPP